jgi:hypothetical protein
VLAWILNRARSRSIHRRRHPRESLDEDERGRRLNSALEILGSPRSSARGAHRQEHSRQVFSYALRRLSPSELRAAEANFSECPQCQEELRWVQAVTDALVYWPTDVLRPPALLWDRLAQRIAPEARGPSTGPTAVAWTEPDWKQVVPGISIQLLEIDPESDRIGMLVRLAPGTHYPPHRHAGVEELHLLHGELVIDDEKLLAGDYRRAEAGSRDQLVWSETGCTCFLATSARDQLS